MRRARLEKVESSEEKGIRVGILGFGTIASAIATGLLTQNEIPIQYISITKRSERKSKSFKSQFPDKVRLITERGPPGLQQIVEDSDLVLLCVLPQQVDDILKVSLHDYSPPNTSTLLNKHTGEAWPTLIH